MKKSIKKPIGKAAEWKLPPENKIIEVSNEGRQPITYFPGEDEVFDSVRAFLDPFGRRVRELEFTFLQALKGEHYAGQEIYEYAATVVRMLETIQRQAPQVLKEIASRHSTWPVMLPLKLSVRKRKHEELIKLGLGGNVNIGEEGFREEESCDTSAKKWSRILILVLEKTRQRSDDLLWEFKYRTESTDVRADLFSTMWLETFIHLLPFKSVKLTIAWIEACRTLPVLTNAPDCIAQWQMLADDFLMLNTQAHPERYPEFAPIGQNREKHQSGLRKSSRRNPTMSTDFNKGSVNANIRYSLREKLKAAIEWHAKNQSS